MKYMFQCVYHPILYTYIENFDKNREIENLGYNGLIYDSTPRPQGTTECITMC